MTNEKKLRVAVIGVGAFGRNHARVYSELQKQTGEVELVGVVDEDAARCEAAAREYGTAAYKSAEDLLASAQVDAASVAVPTIGHLPAARSLMERGVDVLIEKPLAPGLREADEIIALAERHQRIAQVGHLERFNPAVRATLPLVTAPMFFEVHRLSVFTPRSLDVDVVLDLMIHDLDVVLSLVNSPVREIRAVGLPVLTPKVDIANVRVEFDSGCVANFTASRVSTERVRKLRFFQPYQYVSLDFARRDVFTLSVTPAAEAPASMLDFAPTTDDGIPVITPNKPQVSAEEPLRLELRSFLESVRTRKQPVVTLADGRRALELALEIQRQMDEHRERARVEELMTRYAPGK
ncbi:MAG TPA: Gfo/Idh/MocA family oxidoreductase [Clostridia bacterium]|nr:Gfo/Idh/MocA family oxidoreductase [Clostridia bacterium]